MPSRRGQVVFAEPSRRPRFALRRSTAAPRRPLPAIYCPVVWCALGPRTLSPRLGFCTPHADLDSAVAFAGRPPSATDPLSLCSGAGTCLACPSPAAAAAIQLACSSTTSTRAASAALATRVLTAHPLHQHHVNRVKAPHAVSRGASQPSGIATTPAPVLPASTPHRIALLRLRFCPHGTHAFSGFRVYADGVGPASTSHLVVGLFARAGSASATSTTACGHSVVW